MSSFAVPSGLKRYPYFKKDLLQAWDTADELILSHLSALDPSELRGKRILILNDQFGALSCALQALDITTYTDSFVSAKGIELNSGGKIQPINLLPELEGKYDYALIRIPKNMSFFEDMIANLSQHLKPTSKIICGYMVKHQAKTSFDLLAKYIGKTTTSLAQKKARLIFASFEKKPQESPYPAQVPIEGFKIPFTHHSNLFSREKLDQGTRLLLEQIPKGAYRTILDLGCGNGVVGIAAKRKNPKATIIFSDDSQMAIQSAKTNYAKYFKDDAEYKWTNCYEGQSSDSVDLVICNPPFHQGNTLGDFIAKQMFKDAQHALVTEGKIRVIGNYNLKYESTLKQMFGKSELVAKNSKFVIVDAVKRNPADVAAASEE